MPSLKQVRILPKKNRKVSFDEIALYYTGCRSPIEFRITITEIRFKDVQTDTALKTLLLCFQGAALSNSYNVELFLQNSLINIITDSEGFHCWATSE